MTAIPKTSHRKVDTLLQFYRLIFVPELEQLLVLKKEGLESRHVQSRVLVYEFVRPHLI